MLVIHVDTHMRATKYKYSTVYIHTIHPKIDIHINHCMFVCVFLLVLTWWFQYGRRTRLRWSSLFVCVFVHLTKTT